MEHNRHGVTLEQPDLTQGEREEQEKRETRGEQEKKKQWPVESHGQKGKRRFEWKWKIY